MRTYEDFKRQVAASEPAKYIAAEFLQRWKRCSVIIRPPGALPVGSQDEGDIIAFVERIVEVKHRQFEFTCAEDYPYPDIIVSNVPSADRHNVGMWIIMNKSKTHAAIVSGEKKKAHFFKRKFFATNTNQYEENYVILKEYAKFVKLSETPVDNQ